ncbi:MAG: gliding motility-associated C-terminal domain-containing protein [Bacteroidota bacterium]|nr:gliding motility-associated C-terminal domain-containing protein [Bacteroidota bacterium]
MFRILIFSIIVLPVSRSICQVRGPNALPTASITLTTAITNATCAYNNGIITATASGGATPYTYTCTNFTFQLSSSSGVFANLPPGSYTIGVTDASGATASAGASIGNTYTPPSFSSASRDPSGCSKTDGSLTITPIGGQLPYMYSMDEGLTWQAGNVFPNLGMGYYHIFIKDANGCVTSPWSFLGGSYLDYQFYTVKPKTQVLLNPTCNLQLSAVASNPVCGKNGSITFFAASGGTPPYTYSLDGVNFAPNNTLGYSGLAPGLYTVYTRDATGLTISVVVDIPRSCPVAAIPKATTCGVNDGAITVTTADGIAPYTYSIDGIHFQAGNVFSGLAAGDYTVISRDVNGATSSEDVKVDNGCLSVTARSADATCGRNNGSITAIGSGGQGPYLYSIDGVNFQSPNLFSGLAPGPYIVTVKDVNGVTSTAPATIISRPAPTIVATPSAASCLNNDGSILVGLQGGSPPFLYSIQGGAFTSSATFSAQDSGAKTIAVKDANGCITTQTITVPLTNDLSLDAGPDLTICQGKSASLQAVSNGAAFAWSPSAGLDQPASLDPAASPGVSTRYTITATRGVCRAAASVNVSVNAAPVADPGKDTIICFGKSVQLHGSGGLTYQWFPSTNLDDPRIADPTVNQPSTSIAYLLQVTGANGCQSLGNAAVRVTVTPPARVFAGNDTSVVIDQPLQLHASDINGSGFTQYQWSPAAGLNDANSQNPVVTVTTNMTYTVTAATPEGCKGQDSVRLKVFSVTDIYVPNAFSPNGDGHNDILKAIPAGIRDFKYFAVFTRWGQKVFQSATPDKGWDGTVNGRLQPPGTYIWTAAGIDYLGHAVQRNGTVILVR